MNEILGLTPADDAEEHSAKFRDSDAAPTSHVKARQGTRRVATVTAVAASVVALSAMPASADYSGTQYSVAGSKLNYNVLKFSSSAAEFSGTLYDTRADGWCAYARVSVPIPYAVDPTSEKTVCGSGASGSISLFSRDSWDRFNSISVKVCLISGSNLANCTTTSLTRETF